MIGTRSAGIVLSCLGTLTLVQAHEQGWRPKPRALFGAKAFVTFLVANLTPVGSSDTASYVAYGRIAALGGDPYVTTPARLGGAYAHLVSNAWQHTLFRLWAGRDVVAGRRGGHRRQPVEPDRAVLLWSANRLLIGVLVAGGHLDTLTALRHRLGQQRLDQRPQFIRHDPRPRLTCSHDPRRQRSGRKPALLPTGLR
ncbi:hypothetical protein ACWD4F_30900 [Streptomyces aureus]